MIYIPVGLGGTIYLSDSDSDISKERIVFSFPNDIKEVIFFFLSNNEIHGKENQAGKNQFFFTSIRCSQPCE
jgi:hypothetical protein